jgi:anti-anti-sigma factor
MVGQRGSTGPAVNGQLSVRVREADDHTVVVVHGNVFFDTAEPLREALTRAVTAQRPYLVLDLSGVSLCDSTGANLMVHTYRAATGHDGWLRLVGVQPMVLRVLEVTNLKRILSIYPTVADAVNDEAPST